MIHLKHINKCHELVNIFHLGFGTNTQTLTSSYAFHLKKSCLIISPKNKKTKKNSFDNELLVRL